MKRFFLALICITLFTAATSTVWAQEGSVWRVEISDYREPVIEDMGILSQLRLWLTGKAAITKPPIGTTFTVTSSAYAPSPYQTDATPCVTAAGTRVREGVVASNFLPMGTLLLINNEMHIVEDRMNPRYNGYFIDLWFPSTSSALEFGRRQLQVEIVGYGVPGQKLVLETDDKKEGSEGEVVVEPSLIERANLRFIAATRSFSKFLGANVNRYDVDCFNEDLSQ